LPANNRNRRKEQNKCQPKALSLAGIHKTKRAWESPQALETKETKKAF